MCLLVELLCGMSEAQGLTSSITQTQHEGVHNYNASTQKVGTGRSEIQGLLCLLRQFEVSLAT